MILVPYSVALLSLARSHPVLGRLLETRKSMGPLSVQLKHWQLSEVQIRL